MMRVSEQSYEIRRKQIFRNQMARKRKDRLFKMTAMMVVMISVFAMMLGAFVLRSKAESDKNHKFKYYTGIRLEYGDTLWSIADEFMDSEFYTHASYVEEVKSINHIHDEDAVIAGKMLIVPYYSSEYIAD